METGNLWKLKALMKKNFLILKRNIISTLFEVIFPIILILLVYAIRKAFTLETFDFESQEVSLENYIQNKSVANFDGVTGVPNLKTRTMVWQGLSILPALRICSQFNSKFQKRPLIATIGDLGDIKQKIIEDAQHDPYEAFLKLGLSDDNFKSFESIDDLNNYVKDPKYGQEGYDLICFGMRLEINGHKYNYSLHYFDSVLSEGVRDIDNCKNGLFDRFQTGPDLDSYKLYQSSGYTYIMKLINQYILQKELNNPNAKIDFAMLPMPYVNYISPVDIHIL